MAPSPAPTDVSPRLKRLLSFIDRDPENLALLEDAATAAFEERAFDISVDLLSRYEARAEPPPSVQNLQGLLAIAQQRFSDAIGLFETLRSQGHDAPGIRFNLAWSLAMCERYEEADAMLDGESIAASPRGPALKIQMMHHLELYEEALQLGADLAETYSDNQALMGALATLAMDAEDIELAHRYAKRAGDHAEGLTTLGLFALNAHETDASLVLFERALAQQPANPRAWVGKGLSMIAAGQQRAGAEALDRGADLFGDHLGSWISAGWAYFLGGDYDRARSRFERAMAIDANFSESHGGLAVLDIMAGNVEEANQHTERALRLDRHSFGGALAKSLLLERSGNPDAAQRIREIALSTPVGPNGETIAQAMAGFGRRPLN